MSPKNILCACFALAAAFSASASFGHACHTEISQSYRLLGESFSLADLLPPNTCQSLLLDAERVSLGKVPRIGVTRVLDGADVRELLRSIAKNRQDRLSIETFKIPDRVLVSRAGKERPCSQLAMDVLLNPYTRTFKTSPECGLSHIR